MIAIKTKIALILLLFLTNSIIGQKPTKEQIDSLTKIAYKNFIPDNEILSKVITLSKEIKYIKGEAVARINKGIYYINKDQNKNAEEQFAIASELIKGQEDLEYLLGLIYNCKAAIYANNENYSKALDQLVLSYKLNIKHKKTRAAMLVKMDILSCELELNQPDIVLETIKSIENDTLFNPDRKDYLLLLKLNQNKASAHTKKKNYKESIKWWKAYIKEAINLKDSKLIAYGNNSIGTCYFELKDLETALLYAKKAFELIYEKEGMEQIKSMNNKLFGKIYFHTKAHKKSIAFFERYIQNVVDDKYSFAESHFYIGKNYDSLKDFKNAALYYKKYGVLMDSISTSNQKDSFVVYDSQYKLTEEKQQNEVLKLKNDKQFFYIISLGAGLLLVIALLLLVVYQRKYKMSEKQVLALKQNERTILNNHIKQREEELLGTAISISEQVKKTNLVKTEFTKALKTNDNEQMQKVVDLFNDLIKSSSTLSLIHNRIESQYPKFTTTLKEKYPQLTNNDIRHCLLLKLNLSLKECAQLLNVSTHAVKMARKRVKSKINIPDDISLKKSINLLFIE